MSRIPFLALLVIGVILLVYGINAADSVSSSVSRAVSGTPTDRSIWFIILGAVGIVAGGFGLILKRER